MKLLPSLILMPRELDTSQALNLDTMVEAEAQILTPAEKGMVTAKMIWNEMSPKGASMPEMGRELRNRVIDPTERNYVLAGLVKLSRERMEQYLAETEYDPTEVLGKMNERLDAKREKIFGQPETESKKDVA